MKTLVRSLSIALAASCLPAGAHASGLTGFTITADAAIFGYNREQLKGVTPQQCAEACQSDSRSSWCVSFDFYKSSQMCDLSDRRASDIGGLKTNYVGHPYNHYSLKHEPLQQFALTANAAIWGHNVEQLNNVEPSECASACTDNSRTWCRSFDYYKNEKRCDLSDKTAADVGGLKTDYAGDPYNHFELKSTPLKGITLVKNAAIWGHNVERLNDVSVDQCASACTDGSRAWCKSFDYFKHANACDLSDKRAHDVGGLKTNYSNHPYDHYSLIDGAGVASPIPGNKHVLFIFIDGLRGDALFCPGCAATPALSALANGGAFHRNVLAGGVQSTYSGPGWASAFTGFWANAHGVTGNSENQPLRKPHVFDLLKQAHPTATVGVVGDWFNITHNLKPTHADFVVANSANNSQQATDTVKGWLGWKNPPTAIFYYLHNVDIHANSYAPLDAYYQSKIRSEDAQIQQVLDSLAARPNYANEEWLIVVASDHGGTGSGHGGQSAGERSTILILNNNYQNPGKAAYCVGDMTATPLLQVDGATPHILDFLGLPNTTVGEKYPGCGTR